MDPLARIVVINADINGRGIKMELNINEESQIAIHNVALIILTGFGIWYTQSLWALLGLVFIQSK